MTRKSQLLASLLLCLCAFGASAQGGYQSDGALGAAMQGMDRANQEKLIEQQMIMNQLQILRQTQQIKQEREAQERFRRDEEARQEESFQKKKDADRQSLMNNPEVCMRWVLMLLTETNFPKRSVT